MSSGIDGSERGDRSLWECEFARSKQQVDAIKKMRRSMFQVRDGKSNLLGTAVLWWASSCSTYRVFLTAAHVVEGHRGVVLYADSGRDPVAAHVSAKTAAEPRGLLERWLADTCGTHCEWITRRHDPDLALLSSNTAPESARRADIISYAADDLFPAGTEVLCGGYPLLQSEGEGQWEAIFMEGIIGGSYATRPDCRAAHQKYVLSPVVSKGMSGGPLFSSENGGLIGIITDALAYEELGHGWSLATPIPRLFREGANGLEVT